MTTLAPWCNSRKPLKGGGTHTKNVAISPLLASIFLSNSLQPPFASSDLNSTSFQHHFYYTHFTPNILQKWQQQRHKNRLISRRSTRLSFTISLEPFLRRSRSLILLSLELAMCSFECEWCMTSPPWCWLIISSLERILESAILTWE